MFSHPARQLIISAGTLAALTAASWFMLLRQSLAADSIGPFLLGWLVMMAAMMLPSVAPMTLVVRRVVASGPLADAQTGVFVAGYLVVWSALGLAAFVAQSALMALSPAEHGWAAAGILTLAGAYQFSPVKNACLRACRSPMDFVVLHWRSGTAGILRLGVVHGLYCLGCCWALMAVLVIAGGMGIAWVGLIALVVFAEKIVSRSRSFPRVVGGFMLGAAGFIGLSPELRQLVGGQM
jgi:predicted metal-binding membrane protein